MKRKFIIISTFVFSSTLSLVTLTVTGQPISVKNNLFDSDEVITIQLKGNVRDLLNDRMDTPIDFPFELSFIQEDSSEIVLPVKMKTRGHFRRMKENCTYPPLLIQFPKEGAQVNTVFNQQYKLKLVMPCLSDQYIIKEWLAYKLYNLITPLSFKTRLVKVILEDSKNGKRQSPFYGLLLEEEKQMAKRNGKIAVEKKLTPKETQEGAFITMSVFQYLIGNTDWSVQYLQNIKLIAADSFKTPIAVPYDFDHTGIVSAPYANPAEQLMLNSVRERVYRGYCITDMKKFDSAIALFKRLKPAIYSVYTNCDLLTEKYKKSTLKYLDEFYTVINTPALMQKEFRYPCDKYGTGNVIIKGLKKD